MKKVLLMLTLIVSLSFLLAVESEPSETVGYVKYDALPGLNLVATPMIDGLTNTALVGIYMSPDNYVDTINLWDPLAQSWSASVNYGTPGDPLSTFWDPENPVVNGDILYYNTSIVMSYFSIGAMPPANAQYNIIPLLNTIMLPLNKSALTNTALVGTDISPDNYVDTINLWDNASQSWSASVNYGTPGDPLSTFWDPENPVTIGTPMMINSSANITWPAGPRGAVNPLSTSK